MKQNGLTQSWKLPSFQLYKWLGVCCALVLLWSKTAWLIVERCRVFNSRSGCVCAQQMTLEGSFSMVLFNNIGHWCQTFALFVTKETFQTCPTFATKDSGFIRKCWAANIHSDTLGFFIQSISDKKSYMIGTCCQSYKTCYGRNLRIFKNKLECLSLASFSSLV